MAKIGINIATGSLQQEEIIVGIDLGTTNSLIAVIHPDTKTAIALKEHDSTSNYSFSNSISLKLVNQLWAMLRKNF